MNVLMRRLLRRVCIWWCTGTCNHWSAGENNTNENMPVWEWQMVSKERRGDVNESDIYFLGMGFFYMDIGGWRRVGNSGEY